ncbi:hypothetical protein [Lysinibacillus agricola]|uniref:hypothetical protein n=1 Tax=Lysinibacillus agricola TaxID=2590012 RepID=UPI003C1361E6
MSEFETYTFSRLYLNKNLEFFFVIGVNDSDNFIDVWDGRILEVVGYTMIYINDEEEEKNYIYLIDKAGRDFEKIIKYSKQFISQMSLSPKFSDRENFVIKNTTIPGKCVEPPYSNFIKQIVGNDIPQSVLNEL